MTNHCWEGYKLEQTYGNPFVKNLSINVKKAIDSYLGGILILKHPPIKWWQNILSKKLQYEKENHKYLLFSCPNKILKDSFPIYELDWQIKQDSVPWTFVKGCSEQRIVEILDIDIVQICPGKRVVDATLHMQRVRLAMGDDLFTYSFLCGMIQCIKTWHRIFMWCLIHCFKISVR